MKSPGTLTVIFKKKPCQYCGKTFTPESGNAKFCSIGCRDRKQRRKQSKSLCGCTMEELLNEVERRNGGINV